MTKLFCRTLVHLLRAVEETCLKINISQRGEDTDRYLLPPLLDSLQILTNEIKDQNIHTREEEDVRRLLLPLQTIQYMIMEAIKDNFVLRFYGPMGSCRARSVYPATRLLGRLSPLSG